MRRIAATLAVVGALLVFSAGSAWADPDEGMAAFKRGDSAMAFLEWFTSAEQGLALAQSNFGFMYDKGLGVPENDAEAAK